MRPRGRSAAADGHRHAAALLNATGLLVLLLLAAVLHPQVWGYLTLRATGAQAAAMMACGGLVPVILFTTARATARRKPWARTVGCLIGGVALLAYPVGTFWGLYLLLLLTYRWPRERATDPPVGDA